jgi:hypothetical protein
MRGRSRFSARRYRRARLVELERRCEFLEAERRRLERLLGHALRMAVHDSNVSEWTLLEVLCELEGTNPGRAAVFEERAS